MIGVSVRLVSKYFTKWAPCERSKTTEVWRYCGNPSDWQIKWYTVSKGHDFVQKGQLTSTNKVLVTTLLATWVLAIIVTSMLPNFWETIGK